MRKTWIWILGLAFVVFAVAGVVSFYSGSKPEPSAAFINKHEIIDELEVDVTMEMIEGIDWEVSPEFKAGSYMMRGIENKVGFIDAGFIENKGNKYMWHFWGNQLDDELTVVAINEQDKRQIAPALSNGEDTYFMWSTGELGGPNNGADAHLPSNLELTEPGKWALLVFLGDRYVDNIVVEVDEDR